MAGQAHLNEGLRCSGVSIKIGKINTLVMRGWRAEYSHMEVKTVLWKRIELARITEEIGTLGYRRTRTKT